jgi:glycosyltransferase involved in cell wall biosynthesis
MLTLVIPVYKNEANLPDLLVAIAQLNRDLGGDFECVFVIDGSPDRCYEILRDKLLQESFKSQLVLLARNFGSFAAIRTGLQVGRGDRFAVMAADLQEPPSLVLEMDKALKNDEADVTIAVRNGRADPFLNRLPAELFWGLYRRFVIKEVPPGGVDVFGCNKAFRDQLLLLEERHSSLVAQLFWLGYRRKYIEYTRQERVHGKSAWTLKKKLNYLMDSVFSFTDLPVRLLTRIGGLVTGLSAVLGLLLVFLRICGLITVPGYTATILTIVFFGALNMFGLGIIGIYAWRTYENTKARPLHIVLRQHEFQQ